MTEYEAGLMLGTLIGVALVGALCIWVLNWMEARDPYARRKARLLVWLLAQCDRKKPQLGKMRRALVQEIKRIRRKA